MSSKKKPRKRPAKRKAPSKSTELIEAVRFGSGDFIGHPRMALLVDEGLQRYAPMAERLREAVQHAEQACAGEIKVGTSITLAGSGVSTRLDSPPKDLDIRLQLYLEGSKTLIKEISSSTALGKLLATYTIEVARTLHGDGSAPVQWIATDFLRNRVGPYSAHYWDSSQLLDGDDHMRKGLESAVLASSLIAMGWSWPDGDLPQPVDIQIYRSVRIPNGPIELQPNDDNAWFGLLCADERSLRVLRHLEKLKRRVLGSTYDPDRDYPRVSANWIARDMKDERYLAALKKVLLLLAFRDRREQLEELISSETFLRACRLTSLCVRLEDYRHALASHRQAEAVAEGLRPAIRYVLEQIGSPEDEKLGEALSELSAAAEGATSDERRLEEATRALQRTAKISADRLARGVLDTRPEWLRLADWHD